MTTLRQVATNPVTYKMDSLFILDNANDISYLQIDFGDGNGYQSLTSNTSYYINYLTEGLKTINMKVGIVKPDTSLEVIIPSSIYVESSQVAHSAFPFDTSPCGIRPTVFIEVWPFGAYLPRIIPTDFTVSREWPLTAPKAGGRTGDATGRAYIIEGCDKQFDKPIILVEGFDYDNTLDAIDIWNRMQPEFREDMLADGYDFVILNFCDPTLHIQDNAAVLEQLINEINGNIPNQSIIYDGTKQLFPKVGHHPNTVIGVSMGGLVSRYALLNMEHKELHLNTGPNHETGMYLSYDAPHNGANIPLSLQYLAWESYYLAIKTRSLSYGIKGKKAVRDLAIKVNALHSPAAEQLLIYKKKAGTGYTTYKTPGSLFISLREEMRNKANDLGYFHSYPSRTRNVALTDGNLQGLYVESDKNVMAGARQHLQPYQQLIESRRRGWDTKVDIEAWVLPVKSQGNKRIGQFEFKVRDYLAVSLTALAGGFAIVTAGIGFPVTVWITNMVDIASHSGMDFNANDPEAVAPDVCIDIVAGGTTDTPRSTVEGIKDELDKNAKVVEYRNHHCFIPTVSAIDLSTKILGVTESLYFKANINALNPVLNGYTPFDAIYGYTLKDMNDLAELTNTEHAQLNDGPYYDGRDNPTIANASWNTMRHIIRQEVQPDNLYLQNDEVANRRYHETSGIAYIGKNVAPAGYQRKIGDYVIENTGHLEVVAGEDIIIKDGFDSGNGTFDSRIENNPLCGLILSGGRVGSAPKVAPENPADAARIAAPEVEVMPELEKPKIIFEVFPNPATDYLNISYTLPKAQQTLLLTLTNSMGAAVQFLQQKQNVEAGQYQYRAELNSLPSGIYYLTLRTNSFRETIKIVVQ